MECEQWDRYLLEFSSEWEVFKGGEKARNGGKENAIFFFFL